MKSILVEDGEEKKSSTTEFNKRKAIERFDNKETRGIKRKYKKISRENKEKKLEI